MTAVTEWDVEKWKASNGEEANKRATGLLWPLSLGISSFLLSAAFSLAYAVVYHPWW